MIEPDDRIMVLAPHQDDEIIGVGGLMTQAARGGAVIAVCSLTARDHSLGSDYDEAYVQRYEAMLRDALSVVDVIDVRFARFKGGQLPRYARELQVWIGEQVADFAPTVLLLPWRHDLHQDHGAASMAARLFGRGLERNGVCSVLEYETTSSSEQQYDEVFAPNVFFELSEADLATKIEMMNRIHPELKEYPHPRSLRGIEIAARYRGLQAGYGLAEAFRLYRAVFSRRGMNRAAARSTESSAHQADRDRQ